MFRKLAKAFVSFWMTKEQPVPDTDPAQKFADTMTQAVAPSPDTDEGPVEEALDKILDTWAVAYRRRPAVYAGIQIMKGLVDVTAPLVRQALAAAGLKIVRV